MNGQELSASLSFGADIWPPAFCRYTSGTTGDPKVGTAELCQAAVHL